MGLPKMLKRIAGPVVTLIFLAAVYYLPIIHGTAALAFVPLVWSAYVGGLAPALASAIIITAYAVLDYPPDYNRLAQVSLSAIAIAVMASRLKRHAELSQSLNGNLKRLREAVELVRQLKNDWADLSDSGRYKLVDHIEDRLGNLAALVLGWHSISQEMLSTKEKLGIRDEEGQDGGR